MNYIGELLLRHIARRLVIGLLVAAALGGLVMIVAMEAVKP